MGNMNRCYQEQLVDMAVMASVDGARAAAEFTVLGRYVAADTGLPPATGQRYRIQGGAFFTIRDGRVARITSYYNLNDWLAQVSR